MKKILLTLVTILIAGSLSAQQAENPYSAEKMKETYTKTEVMIPMRDGVKLFTAIYEPKDKSVKHPVLMERTCYTVAPYGEDKFMNFGGYAKYVDAGYILVFQDVRGKNMSEGEFEEIRAFIENKQLNKRKPEKNIGQTDEASDTYDTVEWIVNNTNNNGCVGQKGISYPGFYTTMAALSGHPALKAVSPQAPVTDWYMGDDVHHNGAFMLAEMVAFQPWFEYSMDNKNVRAGKSDFKFPDLMVSDIYTDYLRLGTYTNITDAYADSLHYLQTVREHPDLDEYWISHTVSKGHLHDVKPAVMVVGGLFDKEDCYGAFDVYKTIESESPATDLYLIEGPWFHGAWDRSMRPFWANMYFGDEATSEYYLENFEYPFFAYYLEGKGEKPQPGATVFDSGSRTWTYYGHQWPEIAQTSTTPYYLHADGSVSTSKPLSEGSVTYTSDPAKPVPYRSMVETSISKDYMIDDQRFAAQRPDVICFQTPVLENELTLRGEVSVDLHVALTSTDADFIVKIIDVFPDNFSWYSELGVEPYSEDAAKLGIPRSVMAGYQFMVRGEVMRGKYRESFSEPQPFTPGELTKVHFTMPDVSHTFKPGHRLMIQIQSSWFPLVDRNPQTFCNIFTCDESAYVKEDITISCSPAAASCVNLPVVR
ncbi:MAG: CocE/NonD family hydrolase [Bacteroidales bacterium]|nr:CocE/NonD family hydrolase [Bacteroidales bacterium]